MDLCHENHTACEDERQNHANGSERSHVRPDLLSRLPQKVELSESGKNPVPIQAEVERRRSIGCHVVMLHVVHLAVIDAQIADRFDDPVVRLAGIVSQRGIVFEQEPACSRGEK